MSDKKQFAQKLELGVGVHLFGNAITVTAVKNRIELEVTNIGILCRHLEQRKSIMVPYSNVKAFSMDFYSEDGTVATAANVRKLSSR